MKNKILIFALCFTLLLGVFSISVYADSVTDISNTSYSIKTKWSAPQNYGSFFVNGVFIFTSHEVFEYSFDEIRIGITDLNGACSDIYFLSNGSRVSAAMNKSVGFTLVFYDGVDVNNERLISWLLSNQAPHEHSYSFDIVQSTCTEKGYKTYTCSCGDTYTEELALIPHNYTLTIVDSTCTKKGSKTYTCSCGHSYTEALALLPHNYSVEVKPSTCTVKGSKVSTCTCGHVLRETLDLLPHSYSVVTKDSTCSVPGSNTYTCSCGHSYSEKLPKLEHTFVDGRCSVCNALDPSLYKDSEDNILNAWSDVYKNFFGLFGSAQSIFYDGSNLTLIGGLAIIGLVLGLGFLLFLVIEKFIHFRW